MILSFTNSSIDIVSKYDDGETDNIEIILLWKMFDAL